MFFGREDPDFAIGDVDVFIKFIHVFFAEDSFGLGLQVQEVGSVEALGAGCYDDRRGGWSFNQEGFKSRSDVLIFFFGCFFQSFSDLGVWDDDFGPEGIFDGE